jgi:hypothetical protein
MGSNSIVCRFILQTQPLGDFSSAVFPPTSPGETASFALAALLSIVNRSICLFALHCLLSVYSVLHLACARRGKELNWQPRLCVAIVPRSAVYRQILALSLVHI